MARIHIKHAHQLEKEEARTRIEKIAEELKIRLDAEYAWEGDSLQFHRSGVSGCIDLGDDFVECTIELGILLSPMKGMIEASILENVHKALDSNDPSAST
jgi:putative polyhydroxyalkanoate system protein